MRINIKEQFFCAQSDSIKLVEVKSVNDKLSDGVDYPSGNIKVSARGGVICARCWQVVDSVDEDELCDRCRCVLEEEK